MVAELPGATLSAGPRRGLTRRRSTTVLGRVGWIVVQAVVMLFVVSTLVFFATQAMPGDVAKVMLGMSATPERVEALRHQLGLDRSLLSQYWDWLSGVLGGDLGTSLASGRPVSQMLGERLANSATLSLFAIVLILPLSLLIGILAAQFKDSVFDRTFLWSSMVANALADFVVGTLLVALFGTTVFHWFPPVSLIPAGDMPWWHPQALTLPVATLVIGGVMYLSRLIRVSFIDVLNSEYVEMARLKGLGPTRILLTHALPNALAPAVPAASLVAAFTVGGVVVVEYLFGYPGIGALLIDSISNRDLPVIQAVVLVIAAVYYFFNLLADLLHTGRSGERR
ncbi:ABC transporter permease [Sphaerisporangium siamense]|nr:ABC transporter permease [Sphaerisporangium siamense]